MKKRDLSELGVIQSLCFPNDSMPQRGLTSSSNLLRTTFVSQFPYITIGKRQACGSGSIRMFTMTVLRRFTWHNCCNA